MHCAEIQLDMFAPVFPQQQNVMSLMRPHKWAHGPVGEMTLAVIAVAQHDDRWMWSASINSSNGAAQSYSPLAKWGNFADSRDEAVSRGSDEIRGVMHRLTVHEQSRVSDWLGGILSSIHF
jgi:hypothetical protein